MLKMLTYRITAKFGQVDNFHLTPHTGVDYATPLNTQIQSLSDGVVTKISDNSVLGENVRVSIGNGKEWVYGHLNSANVTYGQHIKEGDTLGLSGGLPGTVGAGHSTGPHLHISLVQNGTPIDPTAGINGPSWWEKAWHILNTPGTELVAEAQMSLWDRIVSFSDYALLIAMVFGLFGMFGSKKAMQGVYWTFATYIIIQMLNLALREASR